MQTDDFLEDILNLEAKLANQGMDSLATLPLEVFADLNDYFFKFNILKKLINSSLNRWAIQRV